MMGVKLFRARPGGPWHARIYLDGRQVKRSLRTRDKALAERRARQIANELESGRYREKRAPRFDDYAAERIEIWSRRLTRNTLDHYKIGLNLASPILGTRRLDEINRRDAFQLAEALRLQPNDEPRAASTILRHLAPVAKLFADAIDEDLVAANPFQAKTRLIEEVATVDHSGDDEDDAIPYSRDEQERLLGAITDTADRVAALIGLRAGLRRGEVLALTRERVDFDGRQLFVTHALTRGEVKACKTKRSRRRVPMSPELAAAIRSLIARQNENALARGSSAPVFIIAGRNPEKPQSERRFAERFARYLSNSGVARRTAMPFHRLRHTFASELIEAGEPIPRVSKWLGHANSHVTATRYVHWIPAPEEERAAIDALDAGKDGQKTGTSESEAVDKVP